MTLFVFKSTTYIDFRPSSKGEEMPRNTHQITIGEVQQVGETLGPDWNKIDLDQFRRGLEVEIEHDARGLDTNDVYPLRAELPGRISRKSPTTNRWC
jgi:hypothetical protein